MGDARPRMSTPCYGNLLHKLFPLFEQIKDTADEILQMNQQHMSNADLVGKADSRFRTQADVSSAHSGHDRSHWLHHSRGQRILRPLARLTRSARDIRAGNLEQVVPVESKDEVGQLSDAFNEMAEGIREFRRTDRAKLNRIQRQPRLPLTPSRCHCRCRPRRAGGSGHGAGPGRVRAQTQHSPYHASRPMDHGPL